MLTYTCPGSELLETVHIIVEPASGYSKLQRILTDNQSNPRPLS
jgi:hypothetical protein